MHFPTFWYDDGSGSRPSILVELDVDPSVLSLVVDKGVSLIGKFDDLTLAPPLKMDLASLGPFGVTSVAFSPNESGNQLLSD